MIVMLPVLYLKEEFEYKLNLTDPLVLSDFDQVNVIFYSITSIEMLKGKPNRTKVESGGDSYDVNLPIDIVDEMIMKQMCIYGNN